MLYKYLGPNRITVLSDNLIRISQTLALNDPFESAPLFRIGREDELYVLVEKALRELATEKGLDPESEEHSVWWNEKLVEMKAVAASKLAPALIGRQLAENLAATQGVLSLSRANNNLLMWAHYADSHRGFVIAVDEGHPFFHEPNSAGIFTKPHDVVYSSMRPTNNPGDTQGYLKLACHKSIDWAYEEEVRVFKNFEPVGPGHPPHAQDKVHLFQLPADCIKQVFIGANATPKDREKIIQLAAERPFEVEVFDSRLSDERFELLFEKIEHTLAVPSSN